MDEKVKTTSLIMMSLLISSVTVPAFAEVSNFNTNDSQYDAINDEIVFSGIVDDNSDLLVTIVIRDQKNKFVLLSQAIILSDYTYEKTIKINEKFSLDGRYNATAFITNMTLGKSVNFEFVYDGFPDTLVDNEPIPEVNQPSIATTNVIEDALIENTIVGEITNTVIETQSFVDSTKNPKDYVDRYYNEESYRKWFDKNYPNFTIEEAVGYVPIETIIENNNEVLVTPIANAVLMSPSVTINDELGENELSQMIFAIAGMGVLLGAVYGIRSKFDGKINVNVKKPNRIMRKLFSPIISQEPLDMIKNRLAKGEINVEEYTDIRNALKNE